MAGSPVIGDRRLADAPPVDALAEAVVLTRMLQRPELIDRHDVGPMLTCPEHRAVWESLQRVRRACPDVGGRQFIVEWFADIGRRHPRTWLDLVDVVNPQLELDRGWQEYERAREMDPEAVLLRSDFNHGFEWWLARLQRVAESRQLISQAQAMAESAWREDVEAARGVAAEAGAVVSVRPMAVVSVIDGLDV